MKRFLMAVLVALTLAPVARADILAKWTFETSQPTTAGPHAAELGTGQALGHHAGTTTYSTPVGNGSAHSFSSTTWAVGDYYQFHTSTLGFEHLTLSWSATSSNTGPRDFQLQYSTNGTTFTNFGAVITVLANGGAGTTGSFSSVTARAEYNFARDLSSITAIDNTADVYFRLTDASTTSANGGTVGTGGTSRIDDFTINGDIVVTNVPEPTTMGAMGLFGTFGGVGAYLRRRKVNAKKSVTA